MIVLYPLFACAKEEAASNDLRKCSANLLGAHFAIIPHKAGFYANGVVFLLSTDPKYEEEVSGCTACVSLIAGNKLYVVRLHTSQ